MSMGDVEQYKWRLMNAGNPKKAWICSNNGKKMSALMSVVSAQILITNHNQAISYLEQRIEGDKP